VCWCNSYVGDAGQVQGKLNGLLYANYRAISSKCRGLMVYAWLLNGASAVMPKLDGEMGVGGC